jgi:hypothetical protein
MLPPYNGKFSTKTKKFAAGKVLKFLYNYIMATYTGKRPNYRQVISQVMRLSLRDQRRVRDELVKITSVHLVPPSKDAETLRAAQALAEEVRGIAQDATRGQTLEDAMSKMRGRSWS